MIRYTAGVAACAMLCLPAVALAKASAGDGVAVTVGGDFSTGSYGSDTKTDILVVPASVRYRKGNLRLTATVPWLQITGSSAVVADGNGGVVIDPDAPRTSRSGIGDMSVGAAYSVPEAKLGVGIEFGAKIKLPTGSRAKALGTGKVDFALSTELSKTFGDFTPFVGVGYRIPGRPQGADLRNTWSLSAGTSLAVGKSILIASYDYREASSPLVSDSHELFGAFSTPLSSRLTLTLYGSGGLSQGAAAYGVGSSLSMKL